MTDAQMDNVEPSTPMAPMPSAPASVAPLSKIDNHLPFPVVGVVGGTGSRQALETFFRHLPDDSGIAFIIVTRLAAKQQLQLRAALTARTNMAVVVATDGVALQADQIYLAPPTLQITVNNGQLQLQNRAPSALRHLLNPFLRSLAADQGENAVAILLSGTGEDGVEGMCAIKSSEGLTLVQEPDEAAQGALLRRFIVTGDADLIAPLSELARQLVQRKGDLAHTDLLIPGEPEENMSEIFAAILAQISAQTGHDLSHCKTSTLYRRIARRMQMAGLHDLSRYLAYIQNNLEETQALFRDCLVSVTSFFRDPDAYEMLERDCIPQLFLNKRRSDFVRVWVAGCATGEEAYSIAIQLAERAAQMHEPPRIQVFATDLDDNAIAVARRGRYSATIAKEIAQNRLDRFFIKEDHGYVVKPEIREHVLFAVHDLLKDPPFSRLDLICCRNVLIYFNREAQTKVFDIFHYALNPKGYLFLGTSESVDSAPELFGVINKHCHLYQQREVVAAPQRTRWNPLNALMTAGGKSAERTPTRRDSKPRTIEELYTVWTLRTQAPPRLLVNDQYDITHLFGHAERYLQEREGAITQNVLQKVLPELRLDVRTALYQAFNKGERTISRLLHLTITDQLHLLQLQVGPVNEPGFPSEYVEIVFVEHEDRTLLGLPPSGAAIETDLALVSRMEEELVRTRERLQSIIEEYEISSQELKASNEELQSINEELKSTTEELETSKEELQSMNEELVTVNGELTHKIEELHRANSDLLNLVASTDVGALFLDKSLCIKRFTPRAVELFNLIEGDIGRPFAHLTHQIRHTGLLPLIDHVQTTAVRIEETVQSAAGHWYILRLFPYRTVTGELDGVVITFIDISDLKRAESEERQRRQQQSLAALSHQALAGEDLDLLLTAATQQVADVLEMELCKVLELEPDGETLFLRAGIGWHAGLVGQARVPTDGGAQAGYTLHASGPVVVRDLQTETRFHAPQLLLDHEVRSGMSVTIPGVDGYYGVLGVHGRAPRSFATYDVDYLQSVANTLAAAISRRQTETALRASEERFRDLIEQASDAIFIADLAGSYTDVNSSACHLLGYTRDQLIGQAITTLVLPDDQERVLAAREQMLRTGETQTAEWTLLRKDGTPVPVEASTKILPNGIWQTIVRDITERQQAELALRRYADMLRLSYDAILVWHSQDGIEFWNEGAVALYGYSAAQAAGQVSHTLLQTHHLEEWETIEATLRATGVWEGEVEHTTQAGKKVIVSTRHQVIEAQGEALVVLEINRDITQQKQGQAILERYQLLSEQTRDIILFVRLDGQIIEANKAAAETYGYDRATLQRMKLHDIRDPVTVAMVETHLAEANARGIRFETRHRRGDGTIFPVEVSAVGATVGGERLILSVIRDISAQKAAAEALAASEAKFATAFNLSPLILTITDLATGRLLEVNESFVQTTGYSRAEATGQTPDELRLWVDPQERREGLIELKAGVMVTGAEALFRMKDGTIRTCVLGATIVAIDGQPCALTALVDITARKAADEEVQRLNRELNRRLSEMQTLLDAVPIGIAVAHDPACQVITINPAGAAMLGTSDEENVSLSRSDAVLPFRVFQHGREVPAAELPMQYAATHNVAIERVEYDIVWATGEVRNLYEYAVPLYDEAGAVRGALGIFVDITERKLVEQALQASESQLRLVTDNISGLISYVDRAERYHFVNAVYESWFAQPREAILGCTVRDALGEVGYAVAQPYIRRVLNGERVTFENTVVYADGTTRTVLSTYVPDVDSKGQTLGFYALITDISERKQGEERLRFLAEASNTLASSLDYKLTLQHVAQIAVPTIADWCAIDLVAADGSIQDVVIAHVDPAKVRWAKELREQYPIDPNSPAGAPQVIRTGQSEYYPLITDEMLAAVANNAEELALLHSVGYRSIMIVPLQAHGSVLGAITFVATESARSFTPQDLAMAEEIASRAAAAIGNAQLHEAIQLSEQQLRTSEERLRLALDAGQMVTWDWDIVNDQMVWSAPFEPIAETAHAPLRGAYQEFLTLIHPKDHDEVWQAIQHALAHDSDYHPEFRMLRADQGITWIEARGRVYRGEDGTPLRMAGIHLNISQRKAAEAQLRRSEAQFRAVQQATPDGFMIFESMRDETGTIVDFRWVYTNPAGEAILGRSHADLVDKQMLAEMPGNRAEGLFDAYCQVVESGEVWQREFHYAHEGLDHWFRSTAAKAGDGFAVAFSDITERKHAENALYELTATLEQRVAERTAELERSNRELDQFAYVASHDLKAPLRAIINLANWLVEDASDRLLPASQEHLQKLRGRAQRMERLLDDLLTYSRIGRRDGTVEQVKLEALLQDIVYLLAPPTGFSIITEGELPTLLTPRTPLELIFRNLIGNAIKHHHRPETGEVRIAAVDQGDFIRFAIRDNGPGIEPQYFERIFGMFQVLKPRDEIEGSGMGLAIVKKTVEYRGGQIQVEANDGPGVTIYFTWPKIIQ